MQPKRKKMQPVRTLGFGCIRLQVQLPGGAFRIDGPGMIHGKGGGAMAPRRTIAAGSAGRGAAAAGGGSAGLGGAIRRCRPTACHPKEDSSPHGGRGPHCHSGRRKEGKDVFVSLFFMQHLNFHGNLLQILEHCKNSIWDEDFHGKIATDTNQIESLVTGLGRRLRSNGRFRPGFEQTGGWRQSGGWGGTQGEGPETPRQGPRCAGAHPPVGTPLRPGAALRVIEPRRAAARLQPTYV